jgi:hypothetical protein
MLTGNQAIWVGSVGTFDAIYGGKLPLMQM